MKYLLLLLLKTEIVKKKQKLKREYLRDGRAPIPLKESTSKSMSSNKAKNTKPEILLRKSLRDHKLAGYRLHPKSVIGKPDITYIGRKVAIFVHGCFWHRCPHCNLNTPKTNSDFWQTKFEKNINRDQKKQRQLEENGWRVLVIWECSVLGKLEEEVQKIKEVLSTNTI